MATSIQDNLAADIGQSLDRPISIGVIEKSKKFPFLQELGFSGQLPHANDTFHGLKDFNNQMSKYSGSDFKTLTPAWTMIKSVAPKNPEVTKTLVTSPVLGQVGPAFQKMSGFDQVFATSMDELKAGADPVRNLPA